MADKFWSTPFASSGDKAAIPVAAQPDGTVSDTEGFGFDYERNPATDPDAKRIPRDQTNQLYFDITSPLRTLQIWGTPDWVAVADNGGVAYPYGIGAVVRYGAQRYESLVAANTVTPDTDATKWRPVDPYNAASITATTGEITGGTETGRFISPATLSFSLRVNAIVSAAATRSGTAYTLALPGTYVLTLRACVEFTAPDASPAGPLTLNVSATGAKPIVTSSGGTLAAGDLVSGRTYVARYDGANWVLVNAVASQFISAGAASESTAGVTQYATAGEANALTALDRSVTPGRLPLATTGQQGLARSATNGEAAAGLSSTLFVSPAALAPLIANLVATSRTISAGSGLTGGGDLSTNRSLALGTPSTVTGSSANSVSGSTHTHALTVALADVGGLQAALDGKLSLASGGTVLGTTEFPLVRTKASGTGNPGSGATFDSLYAGSDIYGARLGYQQSGGAVMELFRADTTGSYALGSLIWTAASLTIATSAEYRANTAGSRALTPAVVWSAAALVTLAQGATIGVDMSLGINFTTTMTGNRTLGAPTNAKPGQSGVIEILQDGTGGRTLAFASAWVFPGGVDPTLSVGAGARDVLAYTVLSSGVIVGNLLKAVA